MRGAFAVCLLALAVSPAAAQNPKRMIEGPGRYCGYKFAIDLPTGDKVEIEQGPDFMLEGLISPSGGFGLYEGFAPQDGTGDVPVNAQLGLPTYRIGNSRDGFSYVVWTGTKAQPFYVHAWGQAFKGNDADFRLLRRMQFGEAAKKGCPKPSFE